MDNAPEIRPGGGLAVPSGIVRGLQIVEAHPAVESVSSPRSTHDGRAITVEVAVRLGLPNAWMADGASPNGVRAVEVATFVFSSDFPLRPPIIYLRPDFDRSLAHVLPGLPGSVPQPCIVDGSMAELLMREGLAGIMNQLVAWLENAALGRLMNEEQGWEPVRRDTLDDVLVADAHYLRSLVERHEGFALLPFVYLRTSLHDRVVIYGVIGTERITLNPKVAGTAFSEQGLDGPTDPRKGRSIAIWVWPGKQPSGEIFVADRYLPETVSDLRSLKDRATAYGCATALENALDWLGKCLSKYSGHSSCPLAIVLCARRPYHIIGSTSALELCPYIVEIGAPKLFPTGDTTPVRPAGHRHSITVELLRGMSGDGAAPASLCWSLIGAGSLGSKIALHLARAGRGPRSIIDSANLSPHNAARHALVPDADVMQLSWLGPKAQALSKAVCALGQRCEGHLMDIVAVTRDSDRAKRAFPAKTWAVVNSTATLLAREALASVSRGIFLPRVIETSLYAGGRVGYLAVEGPQRNPDVGDLITEAYSIIREDAALCDSVFASQDGARRVIGEGCGSVTVAMSDSRISLMAAPMAEAIAGMQNEGLPDASGLILLGMLGEDGISLSWREREISPVSVAAIDGAPSWRVRVAARAHYKIVDEISSWPGVETGGILIGRFSDLAQTFYVVDILAAPEDSRRSVAEFVLGTKGVRAAITSYAEQCNYALYCIGTWHRHLQASGPSDRDRLTAEAVALARLAPSVLLIHSPAGYQAVLASMTDRFDEP